MRRTQPSFVDFSVKLPATVKKKGVYYISCCPLLDVVSQGKTENKALENLIDALSLFFISCFERETLFEVLKECGFAPASTKPTKRDFDKYIDVPIPFEVNKGVYNAQAVPS